MRAITRRIAQARPTPSTVAAEVFAVLTAHLQHGDKASMRATRGQHIAVGMHPRSRHLNYACWRLFHGRWQVTAPLSSIRHFVVRISVVHDYVARSEHSQLNFLLSQYTFLDYIFLSRRYHVPIGGTYKHLHAVYSYKRTPGSASQSVPVVHAEARPMNQLHVLIT